MYLVVDIDSTLEKTKLLNALFTGRSADAVLKRSTLQSLVELMTTLSAMLHQMLHVGMPRYRVRKWRVEAVLGSLGRLSRNLRKSVIDYMVSETKATFAACAPWRERVLEDLGGEAALQAWDAKMETFRAFTQKPDAIYILERNTPNREMDRRLRGDERKFVGSRVKTDQHGVFRLAPIPRRYNVRKTVRAETLHWRQSIRDVCNPLKLQHMYPIALTPAELRAPGPSEPVFTQGLPQTEAVQKYDRDAQLTRAERHIEAAHDDFIEILDACTAAYLFWLRGWRQLRDSGVYEHPT